MPYFPMFLDMKGKRCLVCGGGRVALRKVKTLLKFGMEIQVDAKDYDPEFVTLSRKYGIVLDQDLTAFMAEDLPVLMNQDMVICATSDPAWNHRVALRCHELGIPVNSATDKDDSTFMFPAVVTRGDVVVGVSTSGGVPAMTRKVREQIDGLLPDWYGDLLVRLEEIRQMALGTIAAQSDREKFLSQVTAYGLTHEGDIPARVVAEMMEAYDAK